MASKTETRNRKTKQNPGMDQQVHTTGRATGTFHGWGPPAKARQNQVNAALCALDPWNVPTPRGMYQAPVERNIVRGPQVSSQGYTP